MVNFSGEEFQILLQVVSECCHQNMFVRLSHTSGINPFYVMVVDQRPKNRLYARTSALGKETGVIGIAPEFFVHRIVQGL